jgi:hypothetical protein
VSEFEFERGREAGVKWGERLEQERIIKLLKDSDSVCNEWAIALIKGENKASERYFGCEGCGQEQGTDGEQNYCRKCKSYKYFGWMKYDE